MPNAAQSLAASRAGTDPMPGGPGSEVGSGGGMTAETPDRLADPHFAGLRRRSISGTPEHGSQRPAPVRGGRWLDRGREALPNSPLDRLRAVAGSASGPVLGVFWVTISMALLAGLAVFSRAIMNAGVHPFQVVFLRNLFAVLMLMPLLFWRGPSLARTDQLGLYFGRVLCSLVGMLSWFYALSLIPIGEVTAISFLAPLFGTLGAIFLLGEVVRWRRWAALVVGFAGAMIILRPSDTSIGVGQLCAILSAMSMGLTAILVKQLTGATTPTRSCSSPTCC